MLCAKTVVLSTTPDFLTDVDIIRADDNKDKVQTLLRDKMHRSYSQELWLVYDKPWWNKSSNATFMHTMSSSPIREFLCKMMLPTNTSANNDDDVATIAAVYVKLNNKYKYYWTELISANYSQWPTFETQPTVSTLFIEHIHLHLCRLTHSSCSQVASKLLGYLLYKWNDEVFGKTSFTWKTGINVPDTVDFLKKPFPNHNLYLTGSWFGDVRRQTNNVAGDWFAVQEFLASYDNRTNNM